MHLHSSARKEKRYSEYVCSNLGVSFRHLSSDIPFLPPIATYIQIIYKVFLHILSHNQNSPLHGILSHFKD